MKSETWLRAMIWLAAIQEGLAVALLPFSIYNTKEGTRDPAIFWIASLNFAVLSIINIVVAAAAIRTLAARGFFFKPAIWIYMVGGVYLMAIVGLGAIFLETFHPADPSNRPEGICHSVSYSTTLCPLVGTYVTAWTLAALLLTSNIAIVVLMILGRSRNISAPYNKPASRLLRTIIRGRNSTGSQTFSDTQPEFLGGDGEKSGMPYVDGKAELPASSVPSAENSAVKDTSADQARTFWENGVQYQIVPVTVGGGATTENATELPAPAHEAYVPVHSQNRNDS